ncbi:unnamed protein product [Cuscuta campestris]|uniref:Bromo domain-containing protein n=1 Tax=Cuscuta campestris TaxID=132261 RepID=A0A484MKZ0_9ASTE|nr:unnamed protein product [Cuscuta campestris]
MKRKRGSKKGKAKKKPKVTTMDVDVNAQNDDLVVEEGVEEVADAVAESSGGSGSDSGGDGDGDRDKGGEEEKEAPPTSTAVVALVDQAPPKPTTTSAVGFGDSTTVKAVYRRVKVKIKTSKTLLLDGSPETHPPAEKSSQQPEEQEGVSSEKMEADSANNSLSEANNNNSNVSPSEGGGGGGGGDLLRKSAGIKIKSKSFSSNFSPCINTETLKGEKTPKKESLSVSKDSSRYNKKELDAALEVIKKVMKMDAAEPFNTPVDPIALGIPDYFEVIDTPMDFGTIRGNLESGVKYLNSEDVYKDVQCIWDNCYKYNNKGDLVLDLMKRVKKNFSKYWIASGLYSDYTHGVESSQTKDVTPPDSNGTEQLKGGSSSNIKTRKLQGLKKHKAGCLCAICVMIRRRQEREESSAKILEEQQVEAASSDYEMVRPEELTAAAESAGGCEYASPNMENSPPELDIDSNANVEEEAKLAANTSENDEDNREEDVKLLGVSSRISIEDDRTKHQKQTVECGNDVPSRNDKEALLTGGETAASEQPKPKEEKLDKHQKAKMLEKLWYLENPRILGLCRTLFANDHNTLSVWNGPHSLAVRRQKDPLASSTRLKKRSAIRNAVSQLIRLQQGK